MQALSARPEIAENLPGHSSTSGRIAGMNVALALLICFGVSWIGQPSVVWPICGMITAVYGVPNAVRFFRASAH